MNSDSSVCAFPLVLTRHIQPEHCRTTRYEWPQCGEKNFWTEQISWQFYLNCYSSIIMCLSCNSSAFQTMFLSKMDNHLNYSLALPGNIRLIEYQPGSINWNGDLSPVLWENPGPYEDSSPTNPLILSKLTRVSRIFRDVCKCESFPFHYFANFPYSALVEDDHLIDRLRREKFDLAMTEQYDNCALVIFR